ncbi:MAG: gamma-glutamyltransferase [Acidimicrobiales bacterium]|jgi:gamma-glutamyltranspeptidase/glutathione hydrolase|nr:gamma-glutamyltransferase [Acidimicrobiales bacterium]
MPHAPQLGPDATRYALGGMVCSVDHVASAAGVAQLRDGGSAADAAVATSAVLAVTSPHLCGMGGDLFALVQTEAGSPVALNASGRAGSGADAERLRAEGHRRMPFRGDVRSVPVPGCVDGWLALHERFGRLPLERVLEPARDLARDGFAASALLAAMVPLVAHVSGAEDLAAVTGPGAPCRRPGVARALEDIVRRGRDGFYGGAFGDGLLTLGDGEYAPADLARPLADWVDPLGTDVWGHRVWTVPPNSQGYLTLAAAWLAAGLDLPADPADPGWPHLLVEAAKQAAFDRPQVLHEHADGAALLAPSRLTPRRDAIDPTRATPVVAPTADGGTIFLCAVDRDGTGVSLIQSNAADFGAHVAEPATGVLLHNRGIGFDLEPGHPAEYGPGRRPPSTLSPALVTGVDGSLRAVLGTMGGDVQPQIVLQLVARLLVAGEAPGRVVSAPRWGLRAAPDRGFDLWSHAAQLQVAVEADAPDGWFEGLTSRGHDLVRAPRADHAMGHAHCIEVRDGVLGGGSDPRAGSGAALGC